MLKLEKNRSNLALIPFYGILFLSTLIIIGAPSARAEDLTPEEGLKRLSNNIETSTKNRDEYKKAIDIIVQNISNLDSAARDLEVQKKSTLKQMSENKNTLALHTKKIQEVDKAKADEERKKTEEQTKIAQLEKTLLQLKDLQNQRQERILKLSEDRQKLEKSRQEGETVQQSLLTQTKDIDQHLSSIKKEIQPWQSKKKNYEKESTKWSKEIDRHQKMEGEIKVLMDSTT